MPVMYRSSSFLPLGRTGETRWNSASELRGLSMYFCTSFGFCAFLSNGNLTILCGLKNDIEETQEGELTASNKRLNFSKKHNVACIQLLSCFLHFSEFSLSGPFLQPKIKYVFFSAFCVFWFVIKNKAVFIHLHLSSHKYVFP